MEKKTKNIIIAIIIIAVLLVAVYLSVAAKKPKVENNEVEIPTEAIIPTVDSSVKVDLLPKVAGKEVALKIENIPSGTTTVEYSLSYDTIKQGLQGVIGTIQINDSEVSYDKQITLGTCSSGSCVYHEVKGAIKLSLKFSGNYGERLFEKDFNL